MAKQDLTHLTLRKGRWVYVRRIPEAVAPYDKRAPMIRVGLRTDDARLAMNLRDKHDRENDRIWTAIRVLVDDGAKIEKKRSVDQLRVLLGMDKLPTGGNLEEVNRHARVADFVFGLDNPPTDEQAVAYGALRPIVDGVEDDDATLSELPQIWEEKLAAVRMRNKSDAQRKRAVAKQKRAARLAVDLLGDKLVKDFTEDDAGRYFEHLEDLVTAGDLKATTANDYMIALGGMLVDFAKRGGDRRFVSPFRGLSIAQDNLRAASYPAGWIEEKFLLSGDLKRMDPRRRAIFLACVETGARLGEIVNLLPEHIRLDAAIPHIIITDYQEGGVRREVKTDESVRAVPLVGVALEAFKAFPKGFSAEDFDKESVVSAAVGKFLRENGLLPPRQIGVRGSTGKIRPVHSLRHAYKDRLRKGGAGDEMIRSIEGWKSQEPRYGDGYDLERKLEVMQRIALPFDLTIMEGQAKRRSRVKAG